MHCSPPDEYEKQKNKAILTDRVVPERYGTSRITLIMPTNTWYTFSRTSIDYSERVYVNGELMTEVGSPGEDEKSTVSNVGRITFTAKADNNGKIEIIQQSSNFVHRQGGNHGNWYVGGDWLLRDVQAADFAIVLEMGAYLTLFLIHILLFLMLRSYKPNLYFAMFCLAWFFRMGTTENAIFTVLLPWLDWQVKFRIEYTTVSIVTTLVILIIYDMFPGIIQRWVKRVSVISLAVFIALDIILDTVLMSQVALFFLGVCVLTAVYIIVRFAMKLRVVRVEQIIFLVGLAILIIISVRDIIMYARRAIMPSMLYIEMTQVAVLACSLLAATAFFIATMRQVAEAREVEQRLSAENLALDKLNRLKSDLIVDLSHEIRTPLTVMSGYAQVTAQQIKDGTVDEETTGNLGIISREADRLDQLAGGLLNTMNDNTNRSYAMIQMQAILNRIREVGTPILRKNNNKLRLFAEKDLPAVYANGEMIEQLLLNLITNANRHTTDGVISISVSAGLEKKRQDIHVSTDTPVGTEADVTITDADCIIIRVTDTGSGIPEDLLPHIFDRNVSGDNGSGVGLFICRDITDFHRGTITVDSDEGNGTTFTVILPITAKENPHADDSNG